jgi:uncharacterized protein YidB (DUF937 family)
MLDQLINLVKEHAGEAIINNPVIPNDLNNAAIEETAGGIFEGLKNQISEGGISSITNLLQDGNLMNNPLVGQIGTQVAGQLMSKFGVNEAEAGNIVQKLIPTVMNQFASKTNDPNDSGFTLEGITSSLGGGDLGGLLNSVSGFFGK